jgi:hypothetical protein
MLDVASLLRNGFDKKHVKEWAKKLNVENILQECFELLKRSYDNGYDS